MIGSFALLLLFTAGIVDLSYFINNITNAFTARNEELARNVLIGFAILISERYIDQFLHNSNFCHISSASDKTDKQIDNPDQRISQDTDEFTQQITSIFLELVRSITSTASFALLDEATSALDTTNERAAYQQLQQSGMGYISVGHRPSLLEHHSKVLELQAGGHWRLIEADQYAFRQLNQRRTSTPIRHLTSRIQQLRLGEIVRCMAIEFPIAAIGIHLVGHTTAAHQKTNAILGFGLHRAVVELIGAVGHHDRGCLRALGTGDRRSDDRARRKSPVIPRR